MLTPEALRERRKGIGSSDALKIMGGPEEWHSLWLEKTGRMEPKAILSPWDAAVRHALEPVILDFYEIETGHKLTRRGEAVICERFPILRATLDGFDAELNKAIDAKALNIWTENPVQWCIDHYTPQMHHQTIVLNAKGCALHMSLGMKRPESIEIEYDEFFADDYVKRCTDFWGYVMTDKPPPRSVSAAEPAPPAKDPKLMRKLDMAGSNSWAEWAPKWLENKSAAATFKDAEKELKALVEPDVGEAFGHGVRISRNRAGALSIKGV